MPLDAVMVVQMITKYSKRVPRFLLHPSLVKLGVLARFMRRMGGVIACKKNADEILKRGDLLGIYPEGIRGPFKYYKDVYKLGRFGRSDYARFALEHSVPVVPFVMVGPAEIYPIFGKLNWNWVQQGLEWPCLPVTPTFPFSPLPFPLPTKWHLQILPPVDPVAAIAEAERTGREPCQVITEQVKKAIEDATAEMLAKRKSIFLGKVFPE
jgi:1-acyl-sn-glycerol-3-phosphate acyltransferase